MGYARLTASFLQNSQTLCYFSEQVTGDSSTKQLFILCCPWIYQELPLRNCSPAPDKELPKPCNKIWPLHYKPQQHGAWEKEKWWRIQKQSQHVLWQIIYKWINSTLHQSLQFPPSLWVLWYQTLKWRSHTFHSTCYFLRLILLSLESTSKPSEQPKELYKKI